MIQTRGRGGASRHPPTLGRAARILGPLRFLPEDTLIEKIRRGKTIVSFVKGGGTAMKTIRRALSLLVLAAFLGLMAAPVFAHGGSGQDVAPNINEATIDDVC